MAVSMSSLMENKRPSYKKSLKYGEAAVVSVDAPEISKDVNEWAEKSASSETLAVLDSVSNQSVEKQAKMLFARMRSELRHAGFSEQEINALKARIDTCDSVNEFEDVVDSLRDELQERLTKRMGDKIDKARKKDEAHKEDKAGKKGVSAKKSDSTEKQKEKVYKEVLVFARILDKMLADIKSGVRNDYSTIFTQAKAMEDLILARVATLNSFGKVAGDKFNISEGQLMKMRASANNIYKYATALDLQRSLKSKYKSTNCAQMIVKSGRRNVYVNVSEDERRSTYFSDTRDGSGFDIAIGDKNKMLSMSAGQYKEADLKQYQKEVFTIEKRVMRLLGDKFFSDSRYSFTYDPVDGYKISSNGVELPDAPEDITIKLFDNGELDQLYISDFGKETSVELEGSSPAEVGRDIKTARKELEKAKQRGTEAPAEMD